MVPQHHGPRALRLAALAFGLLAVMLTALPVAAARWTITNGISVDTSCFFITEAIWTNVPANARRYEFLFLTNGANPYVLRSGTMTSRSGSAFDAGYLFGPAGTVSTRIVFYDGLSRVVYSVDNSEGPIATNCT